MKKCIALIVLSLLVPIFTCKVGFSSTGGISNVGFGLPSFSSEQRSREKVPLEKRGDFFIGYPKNASIELITIFAPNGTGKHLILRELETKDGGKTYLFSAPITVESHVRRLTIFSPKNNKPVVLLNYENNQWELIKAQLVPHTPPSIHLPSNTEFLAFTTNKLGLFWLGNPYFLKQEINAEAHPTQGQAFLGDLTTGFSSWALALIILGLGWMISAVVHAQEHRIENTKQNNDETA